MEEIRQHESEIVEERLLEVLGQAKNVSSSKVRVLACALLRVVELANRYLISEQQGDTLGILIAHHVADDILSAIQTGMDEGAR